ncbi:MAG: sigma-54 dependent transcriptional regulator [Planctomycetota bacterium]
MADPRILIVDDQAAVREELAFALGYEGFATVEAEDGDGCLTQLQESPPAVVLLDIKMPGRDGLQVLADIKERHPDLPVIMITGHGDIETAVVAIRTGAYDFLTKPFDTDRVLVSVKNAMQLRELATENLALREELSREIRMLGSSSALEDVRRMIQRVAPTEAQVLITGDNGTGKELVARQVHAQSKRFDRPFVALNCAAIPGELLESELFGHEKGAFTGATQARAGHFEAAHNGTLFLDEIGDMALEAQAKLLRALQERVITRLGGVKTIEIDVRVLAATNQDLPQLVEEKRFREDLYYRLHVVRIHVPPLRERRDDIEELARHFVGAACRRNGLPKRKLTADGKAYLRSLPWPGNVRELKNLLEAAAIMADEPAIDRELLEGMAHSAARAPAGEEMFALATLEEFRAASEREFIRRKLSENSGNIKRTAERISIQRSNLYKKLDRYGLK